MKEPDWVAMLPQLSFRDTLLAIAGLAFSTHMVFKHFEPSVVSVQLALLSIPPALATILMAQHLSILLAVESTFLLFYAVLLSSIVLYRISPIHPLARYPGPLYLKTSQLWLAWTSFTGKQSMYVSKLHAQYGDAVRIGPNEVSFRDAAVVHPLIGNNGLPKGPFLNGCIPPEFPPFLAALTDQQEHARRRKFWTHAFTPSALKEYEQFISRRATELVGYLSSEKGVTDLNIWFKRFTYDFMSDMVFGGGSEMMRDGDKDQGLERLATAMMFATCLGAVPWLGNYIYKVPGISSAILVVTRATENRVLTRIKAGSARRDLFHYLINEDGPESSRPPNLQLAADGILAIVAGADTTSVTLTSLFYLLLRHPETYKRLQQEVDKCYPPELNALDTKYHPEMSYLTAVTNEALRLYPAGPRGSQRRNWSTSDRAVGPYNLPPGTAASIRPWVIQRDERNFSPFPDGFWPDRWLIASGETKYHGPPDQPFVHNLDAFIPFSLGPANCVGKNLAMQEMRMVICLIMQKLELELDKGWDPDKFDHDMCDYFAMVTEKLPVTIRLREKA